MNLDRIIKARKPAAGNGITDASYPLAVIANELPGMRRITKLLWSRATNEEDMRGSQKRVIRSLGRESAPGRNCAERDYACEGIDLVVTVAGILWPGLKAWREARNNGSGPSSMMVDLWWGNWGEAPGAVVFVDGVFHLVHLDADTEAMMGSKWYQFIQGHWGGSVLHHAIQIQGTDDLGSDSPILNTLGKGGSRGGCILWLSTKGLDLRPWRVDIGGHQAMSRPLSDGFRVGTIVGAPLPISVEILRIQEFWRWLAGMKVPGRFPSVAQNTYFELAQDHTKRRDSEGKAKTGKPKPDQTPLFEEALASSEQAKSPASKEYGEPITAELGLTRLTALRDAAKAELVQATMRQSPEKIEHWAGVHAEIQACLDSAQLGGAKCAPHP